MSLFRWIEFARPHPIDAEAEPQARAKTERLGQLMIDLLRRADPPPSTWRPKTMHEWLT